MIGVHISSPPDDLVVIRSFQLRDVNRMVVIQQPCAICPSPFGGNIDIVRDETKKNSAIVLFFYDPLENSYYISQG